MTKPRVLFLCTGNSARSQMAEALLRRHADDRFEVYSAGIEPKGINPWTIRVMEEVGLDLTGQHSKSLDEYRGKVDFAHLITVCGDADRRCPHFPGQGQRQHWPFEDPAALEGTDDEKLPSSARCATRSRRASSPGCVTGPTRRKAVSS